MSVAQDYGLFAALVVYVLWYSDKMMKQTRADNAEREALMRVDNSERESRYIEVIDKLSDAFQELKRDVEVIKQTLVQEEKNKRRATGS